MAALRRNIESLTQISKQHAKQMAILSKSNTLLHDQLRLSKAETKVALDEGRRAALASSTKTNDEAAINALNSRIRELQHELTMSKRNEQETKEEMERMKEVKRNSVHITSGSVGGGLGVRNFSLFCLILLTFFTDL
jgi:uncharacterized protein YlxW (UPF0749 family)